MPIFYKQQLKKYCTFCVELLNRIQSLCMENSRAIAALIELTTAKKTLNSLPEIFCAPDLLGSSYSTE